MNPDLNSQNTVLPYVLGNYASRTTPASQILSSAGIRPFYTNTGKIINPELYNTVGPMAPFGGGQSGLKLDAGYAYRIVSPEEVRSIHNEGVMITNPELSGQKQKPRGQTTKKMFSEANPSAPDAGYREGSTVLRVKKENLNIGRKGIPVNADDVEVLTFEDGKWSSKSVPEHLGEAPKPSGPIKGNIDKSAVAGKAGAAIGKGLALAGAILEVSNVPERIKGYYINALTKDPTWRPDISDKFGMALFAGLESSVNFATAGFYDQKERILDDMTSQKGYGKGYYGTMIPAEGTTSVHYIPEKMLPSSKITETNVPEDLQRYIKKAQ